MSPCEDVSAQVGTPGSMLAHRGIFLRRSRELSLWQNIGPQPSPMYRETQVPSSGNMQRQPAAASTLLQLQDRKLQHTRGGGALFSFRLVYVPRMHLPRPCLVERGKQARRAGVPELRLSAARCSCRRSDSTTPAAGGNRGIAASPPETSWLASANRAHCHQCLPSARSLVNVCVCAQA